MRRLINDLCQRRGEVGDAEVVGVCTVHSRTSLDNTKEQHVVVLYFLISFSL